MSQVKVLLVGDFSGVHTKSKHTLIDKGIFCFLVSDGDAYKKFHADLFISNKKKSGIIFKLISFLSSKLGLDGFVTFSLNYSKLKKLKGYDVVQLINPAPLQGFGFLSNYLLVRFLTKNNKKMHLAAMGEDYYWVKKCLGKEYRYSALDNLSKNTKKKYKYTLSHISHRFKFLNDLVIRRSESIIPGLYDYYLAYEWSGKCTNVVPLPINSKQIVENALSIDNTQKVVVFHGWQSGKELKKGNTLLDTAVKAIVQKYQNVLNTGWLVMYPYSEYIKSFNECHIFLNQCYSYDKGMNALLGMAAGKVVFSGAEIECNKFYDFTNVSTLPLINAEPDVEKLFLQLESLILDRNKINSISKVPFSLSEIIILQAM